MKGSFEKNDLKITARKIKGFKGYLPMFHSHMEIVYVLSGNLDVCIDGVERELSKGELSIAFPYSIHSYEESDSTEAVIIMFSPDIVEMFEKELYSCKPEIPYITDADAVLPVFEKVIDYLDTDEKMTAAYLTVAVGEILQRLTLNKVKSMDFSSVQQVLMYCAEHYKEKISISNVAAALFLSESYVTKIFSCKLGCSFRDYINTLRISEAKKLLKNTEMKITDAMYMCGFNNQSSFNRIFCEEVGCTPSEYRIKTKAKE